MALTRFKDENVIKGALFKMATFHKESQLEKLGPDLYYYEKRGNTQLNWTGT